MPGPASVATINLAAHTHDCLATGTTDYVGDNHVAITRDALGFEKPRDALAQATK